MSSYQKRELEALLKVAALASNLASRVGAKRK